MQEYVDWEENPYAHIRHPKESKPMSLKDLEVMSTAPTYVTKSLDKKGSKSKTGVLLKGKPSLKRTTQAKKNVNKTKASTVMSTSNAPRNSRISAVNAAANKKIKNKRNPKEQVKSALKGRSKSVADISAKKSRTKATSQKRNPTQVKPASDNRSSKPRIKPAVKPSTAISGNRQTKKTNAAVVKSVPNLSSRAIEKKAINKSVKTKTNNKSSEKSAVKNRVHSISVSEVSPQKLQSQTSSKTNYDKSYKQAPVKRDLKKSSSHSKSSKNMASQTPAKMFDVNALVRSKTNRWDDNLSVTRSIFKTTVSDDYDRLFFRFKKYTRQMVDGLTLNTAILWMRKCGLIDNTFLTATEVRAIYKMFHGNTYTMNSQEFFAFLDDIAREKKVTREFIYHQLIYS